VGEQIGTEAPFEQPSNTQAETTSATVSEPTSSDSSTGHPAWEDVLGILPEGFHEPVKTRLSEMDRKAQERFQQVHSEYEPYKPFKEQGVSAQQLEAAMTLYRLAENSPDKLYEQMGQYYGFNTQGQGQEQDTTDDGDEEEYDLSGEETPVDPRIEQLAQSQRNIEQHLQAQYEAQIQQEADAEINTAAEAIQQRFPGIDMDYVSNVALLESQRNPNLSAQQLFEKGAAQFVALQQRMIANRPTNSAPLVMPAGGGTPVMGKNPAEMSPAERRAASLEMLNMSNRQGS
jgi:hypothetical protein